MKTPSLVPKVASVAANAALAMALTSCGQPAKAPEVTFADLTRAQVTRALDPIKGETQPSEPPETRYILPVKKEDRSPYEGADCVMSSPTGSEDIKDADGNLMYQGTWMLCTMPTPEAIGVGEEADWVATIATSDTMPPTSCEPLARSSYRPSRTSTDRGLYQIRCLGDSMSSYVDRDTARKNGVPFFGSEGERCQGNIKVESALFYGAQSMWTPYVEGPFKEQWDSANGGAFIPPWLPSDEHDLSTPSVVLPFKFNDGGTQVFQFKGGYDKCRVTFMTYGNAKVSVSFP